MDATKAGVREPTSQECETNSPVGPGFAAWYPQMGGYVGKCVIVPDPTEDEFGSGCFDVWVWHDGSFPFSEDGPPWDGDTVRSPAKLHHCSARQFIQFGETVERLIG